MQVLLCVYPFQKCFLFSPSMGKGCGLSAGSRYAYSLADACTSDNPFLVWMKLKGSSAFLCLIFTMDLVLALQCLFLLTRTPSMRRGLRPQRQLHRCDGNADCLWDSKCRHFSTAAQVWGRPRKEDLVEGQRCDSLVRNILHCLCGRISARSSRAVCSDLSYMFRPVIYLCWRCYTLYEVDIRRNYGHTQGWVIPPARLHAWYARAAQKKQGIPKRRQITSACCSGLITWWTLWKSAIFISSLLLALSHCTHMLSILLCVCGCVRCKHA